MLIVNASLRWAEIEGALIILFTRFLPYATEGDRGGAEAEAGRRGRGEDALPAEAEARLGGGRDEGHGRQAELPLHAASAEAGRAEAAAGEAAEDEQESAAGATGAAETDGRSENAQDSANPPIPKTSTTGTEPPRPRSYDGPDGGGQRRGR